jgi:aspartate kinase
MENLSVLKFGGASVASPFDFQRVAHIIQKKVLKNEKVVVVVSAMAKTTDQLIDMANLVSQNPSKRELDMLVSVGERISIALLAMALQNLGLKAVSLTGSQSGVITSNDHAEARIIDIKPKRVRHFLDQNHIVIVAGFQGMSLEGEITTLGRGGSDTSAVALAVALGAKQVEFYKDVKGVFDKDPTKFQDALFFETLSYDEMIKICNTGAKVLHKRCVELAKKNKIKLIVQSFLDQDQKGTTICSPDHDSLRSLTAEFESSI